MTMFTLRLPGNRKPPTIDTTPHPQYVAPQPPEPTMKDMMLALKNIERRMVRMETRLTRGFDTMGIQTKED